MAPTFINNRGRDCCIVRSTCRQHLLIEVVTVALRVNLEQMFTANRGRDGRVGPVTCRQHLLIEVATVALRVDLAPTLNYTMLIREGVFC